MNIKNTPAKVHYKTGYGSADLKRLQKRRGRHAGTGKWRVLGLTLTDFRYAIKTSARLVPMRGGGYCAEPVTFDLDIGYSDFVVYIDRQYRKGSCEFRAILEHENEHVSLYRAYLAKYLPTIQRQAHRAAAGVRPVFVRNPNLGPKRIQNQVQRLIAPLIKRLNREADASNARIDTAKSYRKVQALCRNW